MFGKSLLGEMSIKMNKIYGCSSVPGKVLGGFIVSSVETFSNFHQFFHHFCFLLMEKMKEQQNMDWVASSGKRN
jgi:hypothetical protein